MIRSSGYAWWNSATQGYRASRRIPLILRPMLLSGPCQDRLLHRAFADASNMRLSSSRKSRWHRFPLALPFTPSKDQTPIAAFTASRSPHQPKTTIIAISQIARVFSNCTIPRSSKASKGSSIRLCI